MKTLFCFITSLFLATISIAQTDKGTFTLGGSMYLNTHEVNSNSNTAKYSTIKLEPNIGYFILENLELRIPLNLHIQLQSNGTGSKTISTDLRFGINFRKYFGEGKIKPFLGSGYSLGFGKIVNRNPFNLLPYESNIKTKSVSIFPGLSFFIKESVCLETIIRYEYSQINNKVLKGNLLTDPEQNKQEIFLGVGITLFYRK